MERYDVYKPSGVEWIDDIPSDWQVRPIWTLATYNDETLSEATDPDYRFEYIDISSVTEGSIDSTSEQVFSTAPSRARRIIRRRDVLVSTVRTYLKAIALVDEEHDGLIASTGFCVLRPRSDTNSRWFGYALSEESIIDEIVARSVGVSYPAINASDLMKLQLRYPPIEAQRAIADYLDAKTAEIDALVADCEREVELLQEYRKALISEAVTNGLEPDVPMKDSGVEWIGKIPEGWLVRPSKTLFTEGKELRHPNDEQCAASQKYGIIPQAQYIALENQRMVAADKNLDAWKHVEPGDFVISLRSFQGGLELSAITGCVTWHYIVLKGNRMTEAAYYKYLFKTQKYIESLQRTCTYIRDGQDLRYSNFVQVPLPLPTKAEQIEIGAFLDAKTAEIDALIDAKRTMADKLREYRRSLISEAVTGKFKVPGI